MLLKARRQDEVMKGGRVDRKIPDTKTEPWEISVLKDEGGRRNQRGRLRVNRE